MGENSKEELDFEYNKIHRHGKVNGTKQNVIVRFRSHQYPSDLYYAREKIRNRNIRLKPSLTNKRGWSSFAMDQKESKMTTPKAYSSFTLISMEALKLDKMKFTERDMFTLSIVLNN